MGSKGAAGRGRWAWGERELSQTAECSGSGSASNWSSALVEELLETNVIGHRNMVVLKELDYPGVIDHGLLSDLRHDKTIRSSLYSTKPQQPHSAIMMEAKRNLKKEDKANKSMSFQNKIVDEEVDRFQSHIKSLRKMNQRLERIAFPSSKKRPRKMNQGHNTSIYHQNDNSLYKLEVTEDKISLSQGKSKKKNPNDKAIKVIDNYDHQELRASQNPPKLSIAGNKLEEHEIILHNPIPCRISDYQNSVFERIHEKYIESERNRVINEGTAHIRHSSPINGCGHKEHGHSAVSSSEKSLDAQCDSSLVQIGDWVEGIGSHDISETTLIQRSEVSINEWNTPSKSQKEMETAKVNKTVIEKPFNNGNTLPPAIGSKRGDQNKLESMSKMYAKWMTKNCVSPNTKFEETDFSKSKQEKTRYSGLRSTHMNSSLTREEKIMQVLQTLQKHKESRPKPTNSEYNSTSRFSKSVNDVREDKLEQSDFKSRRAISGSYQHRLKAHKELISHQKAKLDEQKRQIDDLKLSQLRLENEKSQIQTYRALNEVMGHCNVKVKAQAKSLQSSLSLVDLSPGNDFVLRMEQRAMEQKQKKLLAQERRKQFEEARKKKLKELEEKKREEEEEALRRKNEEAREIRRKEREMREVARKEREKYIGLERKADQFCRNRRLKNVFLAFKKLVTMRKGQENIADAFYERCLMKNSFQVWRKEVEIKLTTKLDYADNFFCFNLLQRCFNALKLEMQETTKCMQVAVDMHDFRLQDHYFHLWLKITLDQQEIEAEKLAKADSHFSSVLLRKCLSQWRKYPQIAQMEREKERRKMIWRNKVQQLLPDFRPVLSSD